MFDLILVSQSPRRRDLLIRAGFHFETDLVKVSEIIDENLNPEEIVVDIALQKLKAFLQARKALKSKKILAISADTVVVFDNQVLGKPKDNIEATKVLRQLSGQKHEVMTAFAVYNFDTSETLTKLVKTDVWFKDLSDQQIQDYVLSGEPMDKAGSYGIQGVASAFVDRFEGSYENVVGLCTKSLIEELDKKGWKLERKF